MNAGLPHLGQVKIPLNEDTVIVLPYGPFRHVQPVEGPSFRIDGRFRRIQVLRDLPLIKGPSAAALYGTAAANGVVVITTKKGKSGAARWTVFGEGGGHDGSTAVAPPA